MVFPKDIHSKQRLFPLPRQLYGLSVLHLRNFAPFLEFVVANFLKRADPISHVDLVHEATVS